MTTPRLIFQETSILAGAGTGDRDCDELYKIAGRVKPLEFDLKLAWQRVAELEKKSSRRSVSVGPNAAELDELYRVSAQVKPLEYDLAQRKIQVKALKQALKDVRRINEKQLVSVRLQAENRSLAQYEEKLAHQQKLIKSLRTRLSNSLKRKSLNLKSQPQFERLPDQELTSAKQRLAGTLQNLAQSERRVAELQKEVGGLNQRLNSRSNELETVQLHLKESDQRGSLLAGRIKLLDARVRQIDMLNRDLQDRDHVAEKLTAQIKEHQDEISKLKTELQIKHKQLDAQKRTLKKFPALEAIILKNRKDLIRVREQESSEQVESLQRALKEKDKYIVNLQKHSDRVLSLESTVKIRDTQIRKLSQRSEKADEIEVLNQSLKSAQLAAAKGKENDIELRRLRSEMQSLQSIHEDSLSKVKSLENTIREQQRRIVANNQLKERVQELESVEADNELRDQQIGELKKQEKKTKSRASPSSCYTAPEEKDDLKKINGIGPVMEKMLNSLGITSFKQVAEFKPDDISTITVAIKAFPGRIERDNWVGGAKEQYAKKYLKAGA